MKAKYYIGIISVFLLTTSAGMAQRNDSGYKSNDDAKLVVNNYYNDYDFTSRINRFHRSYSVFDYYSPVFTDSYWHNYQPLSWGLSIYGGLGFGFNYGYGDYGYDPYFGVNYYGCYDPYYSNYWCSPLIFNFSFGNSWRNNYYCWNGYYHNHGYNYYRPTYYTNNDYRGYNSNRYSHSGYPSRRNSGNYSEYYVANNNVSGRRSSPDSYSRNEINSGRSVVRSDNGLHTGETRRINTGVDRGHATDTRYFVRNVNTGAHGNNSFNIHNSRNIYASINSNHYNNNVNHEVNNRSIHSNAGIVSYSSRAVSAPRLHSSSSGSASYGSGTRNSSSHSGYGSSGSKSGSSRGKSSGRR